MSERLGYYKHAARAGLRRLKRQTPMGYALATRIQRTWRDRAVSEDSDIVIEGFPRSGNTYAAVAFAMSQTKPVRIAHHLHSPQQVLKAQALGIPCVVLIRDPVDTVASLVTMQPSLSYTGALREYRGFYERIPDSAFIVRFGELTENFAVSIDRINRRYDTEFDVPATDDASFDRCVFKAIDVLGLLRSSGDVAWSSLVSRPMEQRRELLALHRQRIVSGPDKSSRRELSRALQEFDRLAGQA